MEIRALTALPPPSLEPQWQSAWVTVSLVEYWSVGDPGPATPSSLAAAPVSSGHCDAKPFQCPPADGSGRADPVDEAVGMPLSIGEVSTSEQPARTARSRTGTGQAGLIR